MLKKILIIDTETTGLSEENDKIIEIGAILYSVEEQSALTNISFLLPVEENKAYDINKISANASQLNDGGYLLVAKSVLFLLAEEADIFVAHNAAFDRKFLKKEFDNIFEIKPWVCTCYDIEWSNVSNMSLINIALAHGLPILGAHRALNDCNLIAEIFSKQNDLKKLLDDAMKPKSLYVANISFLDNQKAKSIGFVWDRLVPKKWSKMLTDEKADEIRDKGLFPIIKMQ